MAAAIWAHRANPTQHMQHVEHTPEALFQLKISGLITIGAGDTAVSALKLDQMAGGRLQIVHAAKTIDDDLDLHGISTFEFQTDRHVGFDLLKNLMVNAQTASRWYFVVTVGRKADIWRWESEKRPARWCPFKMAFTPISFNRMVDPATEGNTGPDGKH